MFKISALISDARAVRPYKLGLLHGDVYREEAVAIFAKF